MLRLLRSSRALAVSLLLYLLLAPSPLLADDAVVVNVHAEDETAALAQGLEQALVRVAGQRSSELRELAQVLLLELDDEGLIDALRRRQEVDDGEFRLEFDRDRLRSALRAADVPVVLGARPQLLVWAVYEEGGRRNLLGSTQDAAGVLAGIDALGRDRGMPFVLPLGDLEDRRAAQAGDVVGGVTEPLQEAAGRYGPTGIVALHVRLVGGGAEARAITVHGGREYRSEARGESPAAAARAAVEDGLDQVVAPLARVAAEPEWVKLGFVGVEGFAAFESLRRELAQIEAIESARLDSLGGNAVTLEVRTGLESEDLVDLLHASGYRAAEDPHGDSEAKAWLRRE
ncbi:DUF2066 domain-containing protein [Thioalkalivibrio sp. ARh3]|uniref:DUF2066 domain-containing protein n=1 Tax=Thioalkalivibrio sp. ARh3 TaxID=1158148 RepID=UPI0003809213|nr:DUF2066 domain-containing protein [Thioalkalivibrio sp. ARh3]